jgi:hypothetical protein
MSSYSMLLDLPEEVRRKILIYTLLNSAATADAHLRGIEPVIFDRPVAVIDHRFYSTTSVSSFWGTSQMTDLFLINKEIYAEMIDLVYGTFALYFPPTRPVQLDMRWIKWAETNAPNLKKVVRHLQLYVPLRAMETKLGHVTRVLSSAEMETQEDEFKMIRDAFPNLVSISLQCYFADSWLRTPGLGDQYAQHVENAAMWWKAQNVRVTIFPDPCVSLEGARAIAHVQQKLGQSSIPQWRV